MNVVVVGSGAGGATAARELALRGASVRVLEAGGPWRPFSRLAPRLSPLRHVGLFRPWTLNRVVRGLEVSRVGAELLAVRAVTEGGCTAITCGNWVRAERGLAEIGLDLSAEYAELEALLDPRPLSRDVWRPTTQAMYAAAERLGLDPRPTPKVVDAARCRACGLCEIGCVTGARWDARRFLADARRHGATIRLNAPVRRVMIERGRARGVELARSREVVAADAVVLAAGGIGTARILQASGIEAAARLWEDIVLTVGGRRAGARQLEEPPMAWYARRDGYILSPYVDLLSHFMHPSWRGVALADRVGLMVKLADEANGRVAGDGRVAKRLTEREAGRLAEATREAREVLALAGVEGPYEDGVLHGGHLGGTVPLAREDVESMHPAALPAGLWVADLSLVPESQGLPTMATTAAMALRVARRIAPGGDG